MGSRRTARRDPHIAAPDLKVKQSRLNRLEMSRRLQLILDD
jgi:hypothetical protein